MKHSALHAAPLAALLLLTGCPSNPPERLNLVLIVVDTLRPDHLGCYGSERDTSPAIDELARTGVRIERVYAPSPWTLPSVASMMTGLYPSNHGATRLDSTLRGDLSMLAEVLGREGYATGAIVSHVLLQRANLQQGFDRYFFEKQGDPHFTASTAAVTRRAQDLVEQFWAAGAPFFLFVHYFDPHYNYLNHPEYGFAAPSAGRLRVGQDVESLFELAQDLSDEEVSFLRDLYDEEIRHTDAGIGRLLGSLRRLGLDDETLVVVVGDHGEEFVEHGGLGHTRTLYDEVLRVPLIIRGPASSRGPGSVDGPVSLVALMPTLLDLMDVDASALRFQAPSFAPLLSGSGGGESKVLFCEVDFDSWEAHQKGIVVGDSKLIRDDRSGKIELYDLATDPGERSNLAPAVPELVARLVTILDHQARLAREGAGEAQQRAISDEELEQLRALGYGGH